MNKNSTKILKKYALGQKDLEKKNHLERTFENKV
jgi:hypothetical protein